MPRTGIGLLSLWSFVALIVLLLLQAAPPVGPALAGAGAGFVAAWLVHLGLFGLVADALTGRLPRVVVIVPLIAYSGYYFAYWRQNVHVVEKSHELRQTNPSKVLNFDPDKNSLVMDDADKFAASHDLPVAYAYDPSYRPEQYLAFRMMATVAVEQVLKEAKSSIQVLAVYWDEVKQANVRELRTPERPPHPIVSVSVREDPGDGWRDWDIGEETTEIELGGKTLGAFKTAFVWRLPNFPFLAIGCAFSGDPPVRKCDLDIVKRRQIVDSVPANVDRARFDDPVSIMLGIARLTDRDIDHFRGFASAPATIPAPSGGSTAGEDEAFAALQALINGQSPVLPWTMGYSIAKNPERLAPLAQGMAKRLVELTRLDLGETPGRHEQSVVLATGIAALRQADFVAVAEPLAEIVRRSGAWADYPALYLRMADVGARTFAFYRDRFLAAETAPKERLLASLAICRLGLADSELVADMKVRFSQVDPPGAADENFKAALFVTLKKLGQDDYLRNNAPSNSVHLKAWFDAVMLDKGKTDVGPNNCMPLEWPELEYIASNLSPNLRWSQGAWQTSGPK